jgi:hypothetical protein
MMDVVDAMNVVAIVIGTAAHTHRSAHQPTTRSLSVPIFFASSRLCVSLHTHAPPPASMRFSRVNELTTKGLLFSCPFRCVSNLEKLSDNYFLTLRRAR